MWMHNHHHAIVQLHEDLDLLSTGPTGLWQGKNHTTSYHMEDAPHAHPGQRPSVCRKQPVTFPQNLQQATRYSIKTAVCITSVLLMSCGANVTPGTYSGSAAETRRGRAARSLSLRKHSKLSLWEFRHTFILTLRFCPNFTKMNHTLAAAAVTP